MPTRNVHLTHERDRFVIQKVKSGRYGTLEREEQQFQAKLPALRAAINDGDAGGIAAGKVFARVRKKPKLRTPSHLG